MRDIRNTLNKSQTFYLMNCYGLIKYDPLALSHNLWKNAEKRSLMIVTTRNNFVGSISYFFAAREGAQKLFT